MSAAPVLHGKSPALERATHAIVNADPGSWRSTALAQARVLASATEVPPEYVLHRLLFAADVWTWNQPGEEASLRAALREVLRICDTASLRVAVSGFRNALDPYPKQSRPTWGQLAERLTFREVVGVDDKTHLRAWSPARYRPGERRGASNVLEVSCVVLDIDCGAPITGGRAPWVHVAHVVHTSWSHTPQHPKYRVVVPLAEPVPAALWGRVWQWAAKLSAAAGAPCDPKCKDPSRVYFVPAVRSADWPFEAVSHAGPPLEVDPTSLPLTPEEEARANAKQRMASRPRRVVRDRNPTRARREIAERLKSDPALRREWGERLGGRCDGTAIRDLSCPSCSRPSLFWPLSPTGTPKALCRHRNSCGATFWLDELGDSPEVPAHA